MDDELIIGGIATFNFDLVFLMIVFIHNNCLYVNKNLKNRDY